MHINYTSEELITASRNKFGKNGFPPKIDPFSWGTPESTLSRAFADFISHDLNLTKFHHLMELTSGYGADGVTINTLNSADALDAPGGFTQKCLSKINLDHITRYISNYNV